MVEGKGESGTDYERWSRLWLPRSCFISLKRGLSGGGTERRAHEPKTALKERLLVARAKAKTGGDADGSLIASRGEREEFPRQND